MERRKLVTRHYGDDASVTMLARSSALLLLLLSTHGLAQVTFLTQPQDATVVEGGDATFQCAAEENGMALQFAWDYTPKGGMVAAVITGTPVAGVSMVTVSSDRTQLTLSGVQREVDGTTVVCTALASTEAIPSNPATISVQSPDDGGVSNPSWNPSLDSRENRPYLTYTVTLTNETVTTMATTQALFLNLTLLQHSTPYSVTVEAENVYGRGSQGNATFNTPDSVPIIDSVEAAVLSLFEVEVNISLLTNGGQSVTQYIVEVSGTEYPFLSSEQMQVSLLVKQLRVNFTKGERVTLRVFAVNSVGTSDPVSVQKTIPFPPNITAPPTELSTTNIRVCCAGVQLNLAKPDNPIDIRVLVDGTPHPPNQVTRSGSFLYIMGLQAGTEHSLNITLSNIFGTVWVNTTVRPLLGRPSTPQVALTPTAGGLTVQLTVMYPGTREDTLQYSITTSPSPLSRRQTGQQPLPVTNLTTPTSGSAEVSLGPGTYSVTVTVTNQHGSTMSVPQQVTIPGSCPGSTDQTPAVVAVSAVLAIVVLLLAVAILTIILLYIRIQKLSSMLKAVKDPNYHYAGVEMESHSLPNSKSTTEPQYEECGGGVTSSNVAMEENPAYQSVDVAAVKL